MQLPLRSLKPLIVLNLLVLTLVLLALWSRTSDHLRVWLGQPKSLEEYALQVVAVCANDSYRPDCYDTEIPKLMEYLSMEDAFKVTKIVQQHDPDYFYCHILGHNLSAVEVAKDPANWRDVILRCPSGVCSNGCLHGGLQERFRDEHLSPDQVKEVVGEFQDLCEARPGFDPTGLEQASCYHALGHLTMYVVSADVPAAIGICDTIAVREDGRNFLRTCYEGVFMQVFQPLEPEDIALVQDMAPTNEEVTDFCFQYDEPISDACWRESWPLHWEEISKPGGAEAFCEYSQDPEKQFQCFNGVFYIMAAQLQLHYDEIIEYCAGYELDSLEAQCLANSASRMIETDWDLMDDSFRLCQHAESKGLGERCYREMVYYSTFNFRPDSEEYFYLCNQLPEVWKQRCLNKEQLDPNGVDL